MSYPLRGLRYRLATAYVGSVTVLALIAWAVLYWGLGVAFQQDFDKNLEETGTTAAELFANDRGEFPDPILTVAHITTELAYVDRTITAYGPKGNLLGRSLRAPDAPVVSNPSPRGAYVIPTTVETPQGRARVIERMLPGDVRLIIAVTMRPLLRQRRALLIVGLLILPALLTMGALIGVAISKRALRPITEVAEAAQQVGVLVAGGHHEFPAIRTGTVPDELGRLTSEFNRLLDRLSQALKHERALAVKERAFLQDAAHEIRTPIAIVRTEAEAALASPRNEGADERALRVIVEEADRMGAVVSGLLLLARGDDAAATLTRERIFLDDLVSDLLVRIARLPAVQTRSIRLERFESAPVSAHKPLVERALLSLIENALIHAAPGAVEVSTGVREGDGAGPIAWVHVRDWGPGITNEDRERVFARFARGKTQVPGSGLGLSIAQWVAERHGGTLRLESSEDGGARFVFELPAA
ncbi:MAG: HAMP domain-containing sensor histidine kinase [Gemmatimonadota bacterium]